MRELVLVHGRAQERKDAVALKREWLDALRAGLAKSGLDLPIPDDRVRFPYYGDTLEGLTRNLPRDQVAEIVVRGNAEDPQLRAFMDDVLDEVAARKGITEEQIEAEARAAVATRGDGGGAAVIERGPMNWGWVQGILSAIDRHVPGASGASIALATADVYHYLTNAGTRDALESGIRRAMSPGVESVVVAHSLGTVVAYNMLRRDGPALGWRVPLFLTLGSPLAVTRIRKSLAPNKHPACVGRWFNAMDPDDVVALYPLDRRHFPLSPEIENKTDVRNHTGNQHGIAGYLDDPVVARRIYDALVAP
jgi:hypothetical protein